MVDIIELRRKTGNQRDNLICSHPLEFRRADWGTAHFVQMLRSQSAKLQRHREEVYDGGGGGPTQLPPHYILKGGMAYTARAMYTYRENEKKMREVYYLTGLMDCMINQINPILRTDLLRAMYKKVFAMKAELNVHWYGPLDQVLFPVDTIFYNEFEYRASVRKAGSMKELFGVIRRGTDELFDILSLEYVFYCPGTGG